MLTAQQARAIGFTVDTTCYPWLAYKGERFASKESMAVLTDLEAMAVQALRSCVTGIHVDFVAGRKEVLLAAESPFGFRGELPAIQVSKEAREIYDHCRECDGCEVPKEQWVWADELVSAGLVKLSGPRGPGKIWKRAELVR